MTVYWIITALVGLACFLFGKASRDPELNRLDPERIWSPRDYRRWGR